MNTYERKKLVLAMDYIIAHVNAEDWLDTWLSYGVADGDINTFDFSEVDDYYTEDEKFKELIRIFLFTMTGCSSDGGLYCDGISNELKKKEARQLVEYVSE